MGPLMIANTYMNMHKTHTTGIMLLCVVLGMVCYQGFQIQLQNGPDRYQMGQIWEFYIFQYILSHQINLLS